MPIHTNTYRHYEGQRRGRFWRGIAIAHSGTTLALKRWGLILIILLGIAPSIGFGVFVYLSTQTNEFMGFAARALPSVDWKGLLGDRPGLDIIWRVIFGKFMMSLWQLIPVAVLVTYVGPSLISQDLRSRALQIYYSRPLTRTDYILGKFLIVAVFVAMITLVPALLLYIVGVVLSKSPHVLVETWRTPVGVVGAYLVVTLVSGALVLMCSSLSRRSSHVAIAWASILVLGEAAHDLVGTMGLKWAHLLSLRADASQVIAGFFGVKPDYSYDWTASLFILAVVFIVALGLLYNRIGALEGEH